MKKQIKKSAQTKVDVKSSTYNIFYNIIIFFLLVLIVYLSYSAYLKIIHKTSEAELDQNVEVASEIIQMDVLNGCGIAGVADRYTDFLRAHNFDVVQIGNYISFEVDETFLIDRIGNKANALKVAEAIGIENVKVIQQLNDNYFLDVSLVIGKDYYKLIPITGSN
ncbi:MAG: LytR C-terminal domain-containing protein [Ignavibacteriae bacterium]|nr:LytR C-terminal domain-containing protein [Ignavibacteriota bacterium]